MYIPKAFRVTDNDTLYDFIERYDFATIVSATRNGLLASHVPVILERAPVPLLRAHFARANDHWTSFDGGGEVLCVFHGPHGYVSPSWYTSELSVPTWNYAAVHVYGTPRILEGLAEARRLLTALVVKHESHRTPSWNMDTLPPAFVERLVRAIVTFEIPVSRIEGTFKLGQNRSVADRRGTVAGLHEDTSADAKALADFMRSCGVLNEEA